MPKSYRNLLTITAEKFGLQGPLPGSASEIVLDELPLGRQPQGNS